MFIKLKKNYKTDIAIFLPFLGSGGAEKTVSVLVNAFCSLNLKVDLILLRDEGPFFKEISKNANIINLKLSRTIYSLIPLIIYMNKKNPKVFFSVLNHANVISIIANKFSKSSSNVVISERTHLSNFFKENFSLKLKFLKFLIKLT